MSYPLESSLGGAGAVGNQLLHGGRIMPDAERAVVRGELGAALTPAGQNVQWGVIRL